MNWFQPCWPIHIGLGEKRKFTTFLTKLSFSRARAWARDRDKKIQERSKMFLSLGGEPLGWWTTRVVNYSGGEPLGWNHSGGELLRRWTTRMAMYGEPLGWWTTQVVNYSRGEPLAWWTTRVVNYSGPGSVLLFIHLSICRIVGPDIII